MSEALIGQDEALEALVGQVANEFLEQQARGEQPDIEAYAARYPQAAPQLRKVLGSLQLMELSAADDGDGPAEAAAGVLAGSLGDFRLLGEVGRGGMGVVYEAQQVSLRRRVALKVLPFAAALDPRQLQRFKNESLAAAQLHHTHIVPVYYVGCERGVHFYAMQFVEGHSLAAVIASLREVEARQGGKGPPAASPLSAATVDQSRGQVVAAAAAETAPAAACLSTTRSSRDAGWFRTVAGLGAQAAEALDHAHQQGVVHRDVKPGNLLVDGRGHLWVADFGLAQVQSESKLTLTGDLVGTLRYMSPEQALAKRVVIDHRSDVYSLGATLYELLTLEPVFAGSDRQELLRQIAFEEPRRPRQRNRAVPAELETIVLKALEKNPAERYATAQELADDLRRYLEDKAILAKRPTLGRQLARWSRRHKGVVLAASLVLLALLGGIAATTWQAVRATGAEDQAKTALVEARQAGQQTLEALRTLTDEVLERLLAQQTQLTEEDRAFLRKVLEHYEGFAATKGDSQEKRAVRAEGFFRVGLIRSRLGEQRDAQSAYEQALALYQQLTAAFPSVPDYRLGLAKSHDELGTLLMGQGNFVEAKAEYCQALALDQQLTADFPLNGTYRVNLAIVHHHRGMLLAGGQPAEAEAEYRQALALYQQLTADFPTEPKYRYPLTASHNSLGNLLQKLGKPTEAETEHRQALAISKQLAADFPAVPNYRTAEAGAHSCLGDLLVNLRQFTEAVAEFRQALAINKQLAADFPVVPNYRNGLALSHYRMGQMLRGDPGKRTETEAEFRQAFTLLKQLVTDFPNVPHYRVSLAGIHNTWGKQLADLDQRTEAEAEFRQACALLKGLATDSPNGPSYPYQLGEFYNNLGRLMCEHNGRPADALPWYDLAIGVLAPRVEREPRLVPARLFLCDSHGGRAAALMQLERFADAIRDWDRALELADGMQRAGIRLGRACAVVRVEPMKAVAEAEAVLQGNPPSSQFYNAACVYALSSAQVREAALSDQYAARAVALLRQAQEKGYFNAPARVEHMKKDADLESLRGRTDFQELLAEIAAAKK
jgi:serine/threonine protein kinase